MSLSVVKANQILDMLFNQADITAPTAIYLSLHTADPGATGASECADATYARQLVTAAFPAASGASVANNVVIEFPAATGSFTATHYGLWSAVTAGTFYHGGDINPDAGITAGEILRFASGALVVTET